MRLGKLFVFSLLLSLVFAVPAFCLSIIGQPLQTNMDGSVPPPKTTIKDNPVVKGVDGTYQKFRNYKKKKFARFHKNEYENIPNKCPKTYEDYLEMAKDRPNTDFQIPEPKYEKDKKIVDLPDPHLRIVKYNVPAGSKEISLGDLFADRKVHSLGVLSPNLDKMVYSVAYFYPDSNQISSFLYSIDVDKDLPTKDKLATANIINQGRTPLLESNFYPSESTARKTYVPLDWSKDGRKLAIKEKVGSTVEGVWQTNLWVYDFDTGQAKRLNEVREAVKYWWRTNQNLDLADYMWDIYPVGWDAIYPNRLIVYAYAFTSGRPKFLGTWSVDYKGERSELLSLQSTDYAISTNGLSLKLVIRDMER